MSILRWCLRHIILTWGLLVFVDGLAVTLLDLQYDGGDVGGFANMLFELLGHPAFLAAWLLDKFGMAIQHPSTQYAALVLGLIFCIVGDLIIQMLLRRSRAEAKIGRERPNAS
jgi:uncharacterized membrane protein YeaQ/YmgE (transglycosylase-associated protein family)